MPACASNRVAASTEVSGNVHFLVSADLVRVNSKRGMIGAR
jgi:hypothetical protein